MIRYSGNSICGRGGIGRLGGFRFLWLSRAGSSPVARTIKCLAPSGAGHFIVWNKDRTRTHPMGHSGGMSRPPVQTLVATIMSSSPVARTPLLLLSKSNPLRWASIWFLFILLLYQKSPRTIKRSAHKTVNSHNRLNRCVCSCILSRYVIRWNRTYLQIGICKGVKLSL